MEELTAAFEKHRMETEGQIERLDSVFEIRSEATRQNLPGDRRHPRGRRGNLEEYDGAPALNAGLVGAAQAVEHYEITRYSTLKRWAELLGMDDAADLLDQNLQEELATDEALSALGEDGVNERALEQAA